MSPPPLEGKPRLSIPGSAVCAGSVSRRTLEIPQLPAFLPEVEDFAYLRPPFRSHKRGLDLLLAWGHRPSAKIAARLARRRGLPLWTLEDGFLRSVWLGRDGAPTLSMVVDDEGIFFDAHRSSRLERLLLVPETWRSAALREEAQAVMAAIAFHKLSKYNAAPPRDLSYLTEPGRPLVLLLDQAGKDQAITGACADGGTFLRMLETARQENHGAKILVKTHPDALAGHRPAHFQPDALPADCQLLAESLNPWSLLAAVDKVYVVSSLMGLEALLAGREVHCFGVPFYAGWGLTQDRAEGAAAEAALARRAGSRIDLTDLVAAAYLLYSRYADPITRKPLGCLEAIARLAQWRDTLERRRGKVLCVGFLKWKYPVMRRALAASPHDVSFVSFDKLPQADVGGVDRLAVWGIPAKPQREMLAAKKRPVVHVEDGFLRSIGLGSDLTRPASLSIDELSLYYDATKPTRMERIILETDFTPEILERAERLKRAILEARLSKYNMADSGLPDLRALAGDRRIILVPGQVPNDASITYGLVSVPNNEALVAGVRHENPEAFIVYKEHPDLVAGNRPGRVGQEAFGGSCDLFLEKGPILDLMDLADEVQVISSLAGLEALMRGKPVACWGMPFYAGWGLTRDKVTVGRRSRSLTLAELVAAALLLYPTYIDPETLLPSQPEEAVAGLIARRNAGERSWGLSGPRWIRQLRRFHRLLQEMRRF
ncbi:MAG: capsular polysaccharide biosynthesis protein [Rhodospirillales bacterium]|nr:capsular polysaccharide biosynthesis protein [Rhodospirillales bacterium]